MALKKRIRSQIITISLLLAALVFSVTMFLTDNPGVRRVFLFESFDDDRVYIESRTLPSYEKDDGVSAYEQYIEELISGVVTDRYRPLFDTSTRLDACILKDGELYVNLSSHALLATASSSSTEKACSLLEENILTNFSSVRKVYVFIEGLPVYTTNEREQ